MIKKCFYQNETKAIFALTDRKQMFGCKNVNKIHQKQKQGGNN